MANNPWASNYIPIGVQTVALIGVLYSTRVKRSIDLRKDRQDAYYAFIKEVTRGWRIVSNRLGSEDDAVKEKLRLEYNKWLLLMDEIFAKLQLSSPNYLFDAGGLYISAISDLYDETITEKAYERIYQRFHRSVRFDLRHPFWSYLRSIAFLVWDIIEGFSTWLWKFLTSLWNRPLTKWVRSRKSVQWIWNWPMIKWIRSRKSVQWVKRRHRSSAEKESSSKSVP